MEIASSSRPVTVRTPSVSVPRRRCGTSRLGEGRVIRQAAVARRERVAAEQHPAVLDAHPHTVEGDAVVHAPAAGLAHPVGAHHVSPRPPPGPAGARGVRRRRAARRPVRPAPRRPRVLERLDQLGGHQRGVAPGPGHRATAAGSAAGSNPPVTSMITGSVPASTHRAAPACPAMWCAGSASSHPPRPADPRMGGLTAGPQRGRGQQGALGDAGGSRGRHDQRDVVGAGHIVDRLTRTQGVAQASRLLLVLLR